MEAGHRSVAAGHRQIDLELAELGAIAANPRRNLLTDGVGPGSHDVAIGRLAHRGERRTGSGRRDRGDAARVALNIGLEVT